MTCLRSHSQELIELGLEFRSPNAKFYMFPTVLQNGKVSYTEMVGEAMRIAEVPHKAYGEQEECLADEILEFSWK